MLQNTSAGLSEAEAKARLAKVGENRLRGKKGASVAAMFFSQFKDLMILILAAATLISVLMGEGTEAITIIIIVLMNATMGFLQEYRTEKTLEALKELSAPTARVRRSGRELEVGARTVVPGDVLELSCELVERRGSVGFGKAVAKVDGKVAAQGELTFAIG